MLKRLAKRAIKQTTLTVRAIPGVRFLVRRVYSAAPGLEQAVRRVLVASFAEFQNPVDQLTEEQVRVYLDLRDAIRSRRTPPS